MIFLAAIFAYFIGSIPTGFLIYRMSEKKDIRGQGSQSTGATNILRLKGWKFALPVAAFDILKGFIPTFLALKYFPEKRVALVCAFLAVLGHCFPVFIKFRGGKGVATTVGAYAALALNPLLSALAVFILTIALTRYVSLGSLLASSSFPLLAYLFKEDAEVMVLSLAIFLLILIRHRGNVQRLIQGKERKLGERIQ